MASKLNGCFTQQEFKDDFSQQEHGNNKIFEGKTTRLTSPNNEFVLNFVRLIEASRTMTSLACGHQGCLLDVQDIFVLSSARYSSQESSDSPNNYLLYFVVNLFNVQ